MKQNNFRYRYWIKLNKYQQEAIIWIIGKWVKTEEYEEKLEWLKNMGDEETSSAIDTEYGNYVKDEMIGKRAKVFKFIDGIKIM